MARPPEGGPGPARFAPAALSLVVFLWLFSFWPLVASGGAAVWSAHWLPQLGIEFALRLDGLGLVFALLVTGIGALILLYSAEYFRNHRQLWRALTLLSLFEIAMLGVVTADDAVTLFLFWEGTTITSFLLIGFDHEKAEARAKAIQALVVTGLGGLAMLAGLILAAQASETWRLSEWAGAGLREHAHYVAIFTLIVLGCFTKSAQFPFHFWLPNAMAAPTPVSAYLHSATMVKAGVYLLARLAPALGGTDIWLWTLGLAGGATMLVGAFWSLAQNDLKLALAHTTVMGLGTLVLFLGLGGEAAALGFAVFLLVHAFYKAALFLVIGVLDKMAGSRLADKLSGLGRAMKLTFAAALVAGLSMAGIPPLFGFIGKETLYEAALHHPLAVATIAAALLANAMMVAIAGAVGLSPFLGEWRAQKAQPRDAGWGMMAGPVALAGLGLLLGLAPGLLDGMMGAVVASVAAHDPHPHLALWHGVNDAFLLSVATLTLGAVLFLLLPRLRPALAAASAGIPRAEALYDGLMRAIEAASRGVLASLQSGLPSRYLFTTLATLTVLVGLALLHGGALPPLTAPDLHLLPMTAAAMILFGSLVLPFTRRRLLAVTALGIVGSGVALMFAVHGAIDVAITQLMVETLVVVILAVALLKLPRIRTPEGPAADRARAIRATLSIAFGVVAALALQAMLDAPPDLAITEFYEKTSAPAAHGRNIVNVILVDFRGVDTMGELAVIAMAGLSAMALLAIKVRALRDRREDEV